MCHLSFYLSVNCNLLIKIASQADKIDELNEWKSDHTVQIAEANMNIKLLEDKTSEINDLKNELAITIVSVI